jgi:GT2 family glycosyltransferase
MDCRIIIVSFNTRELTHHAVESVLASTGPISFEIIVVDNASSDGSAAHLKETFPQISVLESPTNLGFAGANNRGALHSKARYLLLLNSDARVPPSALHETVQWLDAHPDVGVLGAQLLNEDGSRQNSIASQPSLATELLNKSLLRLLFPQSFPGKEHAFSEPTDVDSVIGAYMVVRGDLWQKLGGLDESYFLFLEETDFCDRARAAGFRVIHHPDIRVWHRQGGSAGHISIRARIEYWNSRYTFFQKHTSPATQFLLHCGLLVRLTLDTVAQLLSCMATLGQHAKSRQKLALDFQLWRWHLQGRPTHMGIPR